MNDKYKHYKQLPPALVSQQVPVGPARPKEIRKAITAGPSLEMTRMIASIDTNSERRESLFTNGSKLSQALMLHKTTQTVKPTYHTPWELVRVISGHLGWVRSVAVEPGTASSKFGTSPRVRCGCRSLVTSPLHVGSRCRPVIRISSCAVRTRYASSRALCRRPNPWRAADLDGKMLGSRS
jgi:hypothetical protein